VLLPLYLRDQLLDVVQAPACFQSQFVRLGMIGMRPCRFLNCLQTGAQRLIYNAPERTAQSPRNRSCPVQNVVIDRQCCSHGIILASRDMMSQHHFRAHASA